jgi:hypothetical protein
LSSGETARVEVCDAADHAQKLTGAPVNPKQATPAQWADPSDWALVTEIKQRPYVQAFPQTKAAPA